MKDAIRYTINGEHLDLELPSARKGRIRPLRGSLDQCEGCGRDDAYGLLAPAGGGLLPTLACECGTTYDGELVGGTGEGGNAR